jgi:hypothetical protein
MTENNNKTEFNGTEELWQQRKVYNDENAKNENKLLKITREDYDGFKPSRHFKSLYQECIKGSSTLKLWGSSENLTVDDMAVLACRDTGCELNYCQTSMHDPHEYKTFKNCDQQTRAIYKCISQEITHYNLAPKGKNTQEHLKFVLERKRLTKYAHLYEKVEKMEESFSKNSLLLLNPQKMWIKVQKQMLLIGEKQILNKYYKKEMLDTSIMESIKNKSIMQMKI